MKTGYVYQRAQQKSAGDRHVETSTSFGPYKEIYDNIDYFISSGKFGTFFFQERLSKIDHVHNHDTFLIFIEQIDSNIQNNPELLFSIVNLAVTNRVLGKPGFDNIILEICERYEIILGLHPLLQIDSNTMLNFLRLFLEIGHKIDVILPCLLAKLSIDFYDNIKEVINVISNNTDVIEAIYNNDEMEDYADCLEGIVSRICSTKPQ